MSLDHTRPHIDHTGSFLAVCPSLCVTGLPWCYLVGSLPLPDADVSTPLAVRSGGEKRGGEMGWAGLQSVERRGRGGLSPPHTSCANSILCVAVRDLNSRQVRAALFGVYVSLGRAWIFLITAAIRALCVVAVLSTLHCAALQGAL